MPLSQYFFLQKVCCGVNCFVFFKIQTLLQTPGARDVWKRTQDKHAFGTVVSVLFALIALANFFGDLESSTSAFGAATMASLLPRISQNPVLSECKKVLAPFFVLLPPNSCASLVFALFLPLIFFFLQPTDLKRS